MPGWLLMASPRVRAMTHSLTKASCAACVWWQGAWEQVQSGDEGLKPDQTSITFRHTLLFQVTALRS